MAKRKRTSRRHKSRSIAHLRGGSSENGKGKRVVAFREFLIFLLLTFVFYLLGNVTTGDYKSIFEFFGYITGVLALAFFIVLLVFLFVRLFHKRRR